MSHMPTTLQPGGQAVAGSRRINAGVGLSGGGDLSADRTIDLENTAVTPGAYTNADIVVDPQGRITLAQNGSGGGGTSEAILVTTYGAVGDGVTDDAAALELAFAAALTFGRRLHFPRGTYLISSVVDIAAGDLTVSGRDAVVRFESTARAGFSFATTTSEVVIDGLAFEGDANDDFTVNAFAALAFGTTTRDVIIKGCRFTLCRPITFASGGNADDGRLIFTHNTVLDQPNAVSAPSYAIISNNHFSCAEWIATRSQAVYIFGGCRGVLIEGNVFKNIGGENVQLRASTSHYQQRYTYVVRGNHFEGARTYAIWAGSDEDPDASHLIIEGNTFRNCQAVNVRGVHSALIANNNVMLDWESPYGEVVVSQTAASIAVTGSVLAGNSSPGRTILIADNVLTVRHPYYGTATVDSLPAAGNQIVVGSKTYTWRAAPSVAGEIQIGGTTAASAQNLCAALQGDSLNAMNPVLRDMTDARVNLSADLGGATNVVMIASRATFTFTRTGTAVTVSSVVDNRSPDTGILVDTTQHVVVQGNLIEGYTNGIAPNRSFAPIIRGNTLIDTRIVSRDNVFPHFEGNVFTWEVGGSPVQYYRVLYNSDAFPVLRNNRGMVAAQESHTIDLGGASGVVPVSDGRAKCFFWYGTESSVSDPIEANALPFQWNDGDVVYFTGTGRTDLTLTFKRTAPGAGQFNSIASFVTAVNASVSWRAEYARYNDVGGTAQPPMLVLFTEADAGATDARVYSFTFAKTCGAVLADPSGDGSAAMLGACATSGTPATGAVATAVFTQLASAEFLPIVQGIDADSRTLDPHVFIADIVPGVGFTITHDASVTGAEQFAFSIAG